MGKENRVIQPYERMSGQISGGGSISKKSFDIELKNKLTTTDVGFSITDEPTKLLVKEVLDTCDSTHMFNINIKIVGSGHDSETNEYFEGTLINYSADYLHATGLNYRNIQFIKIYAFSSTGDTYVGMSLSDDELKISNSFVDQMHSTYNDETVESLKLIIDLYGEFNN